MRRACLVGTFSLLLVAWAAWPVRAQGPLATEAARVASLAPGAAPSLSVAADGRATLAWVAAPALQVARAPRWRPEEWPLPADAPAVVALASRAGPPLSLAYTYAADEALMAQRLPLGEPPPDPQPLPPGAALALDERGLLAMAWAEAERLVVWREATALTQTVPLPPEAVAEGRPVTALRLAVDDLGQAHLAWAQGGALYYAQASAEGQAQPVASLLEAEPPLALAPGPGGAAHLLWQEEGRLWHARAGEGAATRQVIAEGAEAVWLGAATDGYARLHLAWAVREGEALALYYRRLFEPPAQLAVVQPLEGALLLADAEARVATNLAPGDLLRVEFYLAPEGGLAGDGDDPWIELGVDNDGDDGWAAALPIADLLPGRRYRVVALGVTAGGLLLRADGPWFAAQPPTRPQLWLYGAADAPPEAEARQVTLWCPSADAWPTRVDLYAQPVQPDRCAPTGHCAPLPSAQPIYLGDYALDRPPGLALGASQEITFSARALPEGAYTLAALAHREDAPATWFVGDAAWQVARQPRARVSIAAPTSTAVVGPRLVLAAQLDDPLASVRRVDFYLEPAPPSLAEGGPEATLPPAPADLLWVGSDAEGLDGWMAHLLVNDYWLGGPWRAWALAYDDQGLADSACSPQPFTIRGAEHASVQWLSPLGERPLAGVEPIRVAVSAPRQGVTLTAHLVDAEGQRLLGALTPEGEAWRLDWDTRTAPDGRHRLLLGATHDDGFHRVHPGAWVQVANAAAGLAWASPAGGEAQTGLIMLSIPSIPTHAAGAEPAHAYLRDGQGRWLPIATLQPDPSGWRALWDSHAVLDGDYTLVALAPSDDGRLARVERPLAIRNRAPEASWGALREVWRGVQRLQWRAESPTGQPVRVALEYSPDDGRHWAPLAHDLASDSWLWDTRRSPDSTQARLRLTACAADACARALSPRLAVDNVNRPPAVALLHPPPGLAAVRALRVWWRAWDPDGDALTAELAYRQGAGAWQALFTGPAEQTPYLWDARALPAGDYSLRLVVRDGRGAQAVATREIALGDNAPPTVRLVWPNQSARLSDEVAILYHAADRDGDPLSIALHYSDNGGQAWLPIAEGLENSGYYVWRVSFLPPGAHYRLRVVARDGLHQAVDESDGVLVIGRAPPPRVTLWWPQAGDTLSGLQWLRWAVSDPERRSLRAEVSMRFAGATLWWPLATDLPNDGLYLWDSRRLPDGAYALRVTLTSEAVSASAVTSGAVAVQNHTNRAPSVALLSPLGGEVWWGLREVAWRARDANGDVLTATVSVSADGGLRWHDVAQVDARLGSALWDTTAWPSGGRYLLRVRVSDGRATAEARSAGALALVNRQTMPPHVAALALRGADALAGGGLLMWRAEDADGDRLAVEVGVSADGGASWQALGQGPADVGQFVLPRSLAAGERLRLVVSDGLYRLQAALEPAEGPPLQRPQVEILSPAEGEAWSGTQPVLWRASDPLGQGLTLRLEASADGGLTWQALARDLPNTGQWAWDTTAVPNGRYRLRLTADNGRLSGARLSPSFDVRNPRREAPTVTLLTPRGGEVWSGMQEIRWQAEDADGDALTVRLFYSTDRGAQWTPLSPPLADVGRYVCDTTALPNAEEVWLAITAADGISTARASPAGAVAVRNAQAPLLRLTAPSAAHWQGEQVLRWRTAHAAHRSPQVSLEASLDGGPWRALATGLPPQGAYAWDASSLPEGTRVRLRAVARDGLAQAVAYVWGPFIVRGGKPAPWQPLYPR